MTVLITALWAIRSMKVGALRRWRARQLRRRLIPLLSALLERLYMVNASHELMDDFHYLRHREQLEATNRSATMLLEEEKRALRYFLQQLSRINIVSADTKRNREEAILSGQRLLHDLKEFGV